MYPLANAHMEHLINHSLTALSLTDLLLIVRLCVYLGIVLVTAGKLLAQIAAVHLNLFVLILSTVLSLASPTAQCSRAAAVQVLLQELHLCHLPQVPLRPLHPQLHPLLGLSLATASFSRPPDLSALKSALEADGSQRL